MPPVKFTVDTHLFRELGELLVGRDSTALIELIKNSYDADASTVIVYGDSLQDTKGGSIRVTDDGLGMTFKEFERGFLRIASRAKEEGRRQSRHYNRRYTGAKGIGRLAAHKLARLIEIESVSAHNGGAPEALEARIDWDLVERFQTLDELANTDAVIAERIHVRKGARSGTTITLRRLRGRWQTTQRSRFLGEVQGFEPPSLLFSPLPRNLLSSDLLVPSAEIRDAQTKDPGFSVRLEGDFATGEDYWTVLAQSVSWIVEVQAKHGSRRIHYHLTPTRRTLREIPEAEVRHFSLKHPDPEVGPFFYGRILVREGAPTSSVEGHWARRAAGIRVFMEGFRVLPYGEPGNDWLDIDADYTRRQRVIRNTLLQEIDLPTTREDVDQGLVILPNRGYFGGIFLRQTENEALRMLVNREGFVPDSTLEHLRDLVRTGVDIATRVRASVAAPSRAARREQRARSKQEASDLGPAEKAKNAIRAATPLIQEVRRLASAGNTVAAAATLDRALGRFSEIVEATDSLDSARAMTHVLASIGTQMTGFVHEINGLVSSAGSIDAALARLRRDQDISRDTRRELAKLHRAFSDFRRVLERQASYLIDVVTPDARRRRSRQSFKERFESALRLFQGQAERRGIEIANEIPESLQSPPMFPAEVTTIFSNLLSNAIKAAGRDGRIRATGEQVADAGTRIVIENTGRSVDLRESERWFRPFESTTARVDPILGQGMGMGLPITRTMLDEYDVEIKFCKPSKGFATALEMLFP